MSLQPQSHGEAIAIFRAEVIGALTRQMLARGELRASLKELSKQRFRPPGSLHMRTFALSTLERWFYAYRRGGLAALVPKRRRDRGHGRAFTPAQRQLVLDIARENPTVPASVILRTLVADGRVGRAQVSLATMQRVLREHKLERPRLAQEGELGRRRWQAQSPGQIWHADVCHGPALNVSGRSHPLRIHAILDDCSRFIIAIEAFHSETEQDMLELFARALRRHGRPKTLYLDNGSTYSGKALQTACARLQISLVHAAPYDPQARGKMERFWRTLRAQCLSHLSLSVNSLHDVNVRLWAWLDQHYHVACHSSLLGKSPGQVLADARPQDGELDEERLRDALTVRRTRRLRNDGTLKVDGHIVELEHSFIRPGQRLVVAHCLLDAEPVPWVEHEGERFELRVVDAIHNGKRGRKKARKDEQNQSLVSFDPASAQLDAATQREPYHQRKEVTS